MEIKYTKPLYNIPTYDGVINSATMEIIKAEDNSDYTRFKNILEELLDTYTKKNHDYGNSFDKSLDKYGLVASIVRISDKFNRLESLISKEAKVKDESIEDTLLDMANYCIMSVKWLRNSHMS